MIYVGSDFSGVGAFDQALMRLEIDYKTVFACDIDRFARQTYIHNYGMPDYFPENVYDREIPKESLDIYMTSPPCQAFSLAGKRKGESDKRGVLFYNSHEFIKKNKPRYFIFENVKGLLSDDSGKTFQRWLDMLGGKTVNGNPVIFPHEDCVPYHIYWKVINAKDYNVPQNRERVFIVGIRDDADNSFRWPKPEPLTKMLKDILDDKVDEKYFLSEKMLNGFINKPTIGFENRFKPLNQEDDYLNTITTNSGSRISDNFIKIKSNTKKGFEIAHPGDSINFSIPNSKTRRGRVGKEVLQTLDTACNQGVFIGAIRGRYPDNPKSRISGLKTQQMLETEFNEFFNTITTVQKDNVLIEGEIIRRITPREAFRGMDFPDSFSWPVSDTQAYKQAGNSIVVSVLEKIISKLKL